MVKKVFVNGTFDLLHPGHLSLLEFAKKQGDYLFVALDTDERIRSLKGEQRPINNLNFRKEMMLGLKPVDEVTQFGSNEELINIIRNFKPDVMIVGSDHKNKNVIGCEYAKKLIFFERDTRYSSTKIIDDIISRR